MRQLDTDLWVAERPNYPIARGARRFILGRQGLWPGRRWNHACEVNHHPDHQRHAASLSPARRRSIRACSEFGSESAGSERGLARHGMQLWLAMP
jgi:hypothetical protein